MTTAMRARISLPMTLWLTAVWVAVFSSLELLIILSGVLIALVVQLAFPLPTNKHLWHFRLFPFLSLAAHFLWDLVHAGVEVAWVVLTGHDHDDGIVRCEVRSNNPVYMTIVAAMTSMIPGTIVIEASRKESALYLHVLNLEVQGGIEGVRRAVRAQEARVLTAFAPTPVLKETGLKKQVSKVKEVTS